MIQDTEIILLYIDTLGTRFLLLFLALQSSHATESRTCKPSPYIILEVMKYEYQASSDSKSKPATAISLRVIHVTIKTKRSHFIVLIYYLWDTEKFLKTICILQMKVNIFCFITI